MVLPPVHYREEVVNVGALLRQAIHRRPDPGVMDRHGHRAIRRLDCGAAATRHTVVHSRVPVLVTFGEFARDRGAKSLADLPEHIEAFISHRVAERASLRADGRTGPTLAKDLRGPIEQMLAVALPGFCPTGRRHHPMPFASAVPGFFDYLVDERGLRPASIEQYRHHLDRFEAYLDRIGVRQLDELSPAVLSSYVVERASMGLARVNCPVQCRSTAGLPALRAPRGPVSHATFPARSGGPRSIGWPPFPARSPGRT